MWAKIRRLSLLRNPKLLVAFQFGLGLFILLFGAKPHGWALQSMLLIAIIVGVWAVSTKDFRVSIFPHPTRRMELKSSGPYRVIRHPMYLAVILGAFSFAAGAGWLVKVAWLVLAGVIAAKIDLEEGLLIKKYPRYRRYQEKTWRLLPFLY